MFVANDVVQRPLLHTDMLHCFSALILALSASAQVLPKPFFFKFVF